MNKDIDKLEVNFIKSGIEDAVVVFEARYSSIERTLIKNPNTKYSWIGANWACDIDNIVKNGGISTYYSDDLNNLESLKIIHHLSGYGYGPRWSSSSITKMFRHDVIDRNGTTALVVCTPFDVYVFNNAYLWNIDKFIDELTQLIENYIKSTDAYQSIINKNKHLVGYPITHTYNLKEWGNEEEFTKWVGGWK